MKITSIFIFSIILFTPFNFAKGQDVKIGDQIWSASNLDVLTFRNGDSIPKAQTSEEWIKAMNNMQPAWCYILNSKNIKTYLTNYKLNDVNKMQTN